MILLLSAFTVVPPVSGRREGFEAHIRSCNLIDLKAKARLARESARPPSSSNTNSSRHLQDHSSDTESASSRGSSPGLTLLSKEQQKRFESDLCKLWVANGWAWNGVIQPQTRIFFRDWVPGAKLPDRHKLSGPILRSEVEASNSAMHDDIKGRIAIGMSDGWKNIKRDSLLATMLSVDYKVCFDLLDMHTGTLTLIFHLRLTQSRFMMSLPNVRRQTII